MISLIMLILLTVEQEQTAVPPERLAKARDVLKQAEQAALAVENRAERVKLLANIAEEQIKANQLDETRRLLMQADELFTSSKSIQSRQRLSCLISMTSAYTQLDDIDAISRWMEKHSKEKLKLPAVWMNYLATTKRYEQLEKVREKIYANGKPDADSFYLSLASVGQLAFYHYRKGNQQDVERLLKTIQGNSTSTALFFRNTFAAQACWQLKQGQSRYAGSLLHQAEYWQRSYEKLEQVKSSKERQVQTWARLQARAADATGAKSTLLKIGVPQPEKLPACFVNSSWDDLITCTKELALSTDLKIVSNFVTTSFGEKRLPEAMVVLALKGAAESVERMQGEKEAVNYWKATHAAIRNEQLHHPLTLAKVYHQLHRNDNQEEHRNKSLDATERSFQLCKAYMIDRPEKEHGWKMLHTCYDLFQIHQESRVTELLGTIVKRLDTWELEEDQNSPHNYLSFYFGTWIFDQPNSYQEVRNIIDSIKHPRLRSEAYLGLARGLLRTKKPPEQEIFDSSF